MGGNIRTFVLEPLYSSNQLGFIFHAKMTSPAPEDSIHHFEDPTLHTKRLVRKSVTNIVGDLQRCLADVERLDAHIESSQRAALYHHVRDHLKEMRDPEFIADDGWMDKKIIHLGES